MRRKEGRRGGPACEEGCPREGGRRDRVFFPLDFIKWNLKGKVEPEAGFLITLNLKFGFDKPGWLTSPARTSAEGGCSFEDGAGLCFPLFSPPMPRRGAEERMLPARRAPWFVQWGGFGGEGDHPDLGCPLGPWLPSVFGKASFYGAPIAYRPLCYGGTCLVASPHPNHPMGKKPFHPHSPHGEPKIQTSPAPSPKLPGPVSSRGRIWTQDTSALNQDGPTELSCTPRRCWGLAMERDPAP